MIPVTYFDSYDKIEDNLLSFGNGISLAFVVNLFSKDYKDPKYNKLNLSIYQSESKQVNRSVTTTLYRNFTYFMTIKVRDNFESGVMIRSVDMIKFRLLVDNAEKLFDAFIVNNGVLEMKSKNPYQENVGGRILKFKAQKYVYQDGYEAPGLVFYIAKDVSVALDINKYYELKYLIDGFNMYQSAITMVNFLTFTKKDANKIMEDQENNRGM